MLTSTLSLGIGLLLLTLALGLLVWSRSLNEEAGLPEGKVIYTDAGTWFDNDEVLSSRTLHLVGKPDYLVEEADGMIVPVELKSGKAPADPHEGHILQLAAYCRLVEENYGVRPTHGIIQYKGGAFAVDYTAELEEDLLDLLADMREDLYAADVDRDHNSWVRCSRCGLRGQCSQRLG
ncbi:MAG: Dna2/Cas4 domain-containing protein [Chloroflexi bacterium]|nr:Dna2/Cas4 domain-containing protein [Chloroflexota bacterium]